MTTENNTNMASWNFGKYRDAKRPLAFLVIEYTVKGVPEPQPLVMPFSYTSRPAQVIEKLLDAGADYIVGEPEDALKQRLQNLDILDGEYVQHVGWHRDIFLLPPKQFGEAKSPVMIDSNIADEAALHFVSCGTLADWQEKIAKPSAASSYCSFGIMAALAAPLYEHLVHDEGVIFNLAAQSSVGKSTAQQVAESVSGYRKELLTFYTSDRGLCENLASSSSTLFVLDDWEKIRAPGKKSPKLQELSHLMTAGSSQKYSQTVTRSNLPDLHWSCPVLCSGPETVEQQAIDDDFQRTDGDRVRMIDIPVLAPDWIWDRADGLSSEQQSKRCVALKNAVQTAHGTALPAWLEHVQPNRAAVVEKAERLVESYIERTKQPGDSGQEMRVARKFAIIYAAGKLAVQHGLLPWDKNLPLNAVLRLHKLARDVLLTESKQLYAALLSVNDATSVDEDFPTVQGAQRPRFKAGCQPDGFIREDGSQRTLYITQKALARITGKPESAKRFMSRMKQLNALDGASAGRNGKQPEVLIGRKKANPRMLKIDLDAFDRELANLS